MSQQFAADQRQAIYFTGSGCQKKLKAASPCFVLIMGTLSRPRLRGPERSESLKPYKQIRDVLMLYRPKVGLKYIRIKYISSDTWEAGAVIKGPA